MMTGGKSPHQHPYLVPTHAVPVRGGGIGAQLSQNSISLATTAPLPPHGVATSAANLHSNSHLCVSSTAHQQTAAREDSHSCSTSQSQYFDWWTASKRGAAGEPHIVQRVLSSHGHDDYLPPSVGSGPQPYRLSSPVRLASSAPQRGAMFDGYVATAASNGVAAAAAVGGSSSGRRWFEVGVGHVPLSSQARPAMKSQMMHVSPIVGDSASLLSAIQIQVSMLMEQQHGVMRGALQEFKSDVDKSFASLESRLSSLEASCMKVEALVGRELSEARDERNELAAKLMQAQEARDQAAVTMASSVAGGGRAPTPLASYGAAARAPSPASSALRSMLESAGPPNGSEVVGGLSGGSGGTRLQKLIEAVRNSGSTPPALVIPTTPQAPAQPTAATSKPPLSQSQVASTAPPPPSAASSAVTAQADPPSRVALLQSALSTVAQPSANVVNKPPSPIPLVAETMPPASTNSAKMAVPATTTVEGPGANRQTHASLQPVSADASKQKDPTAVTLPPSVPASIPQLAAQVSPDGSAASLTAVAGVLPPPPAAAATTTSAMNPAAVANAATQPSAPPLPAQAAAAVPVSRVLDNAAVPLSAAPSAPNVVNVAAAPNAVSFVAPASATPVSTGNVPQPQQGNPSSLFQRIPSMQSNNVKS